MASNVSRRRTIPAFEYSYPTTENFFSKAFPDKLFDWSEKYDGSNITIFSTDVICSRNNPINLNKHNKYMLNGVDLTAEKQKIVPILRKMIEELKEKIECEFEINIVGELITLGNTDLQRRYNTPQRYKTGDVFYYGMVIFNCKNENVVKHLKEFNVSKKTEKEKIYYRIYLNETLINFFNKYNLMTPNYFGKFTFNDFMKNDEMLNPFVDSRIEGYILSNEYYCLKLKNPLEGENSLFAIREIITKINKLLYDMKSKNSVKSENSPIEIDENASDLDKQLDDLLLKEPMENENNLSDMKENCDEINIKKYESYLEYLKKMELLYTKQFTDIATDEVICNIVEKIIGKGIIDYNILNTKSDKECAKIIYPEIIKEITEQNKKFKKQQVIISAIKTIKNHHHLSQK